MLWEKVPLVSVKSAFSLLFWHKILIPNFKCYWHEGLCMSRHTGSHKNCLNLLCEKYLNESHWPMRRIRLLECSISALMWCLMISWWIRHISIVSCKWIFITEAQARLASAQSPHVFSLYNIHTGRELQTRTCGRPNSLVGKTVCLCLTTSCIPLPQWFESRWRHASK